jgi:hypothetical protein
MARPLTYPYLVFSTQPSRITILVMSDTLPQVQRPCPVRSWSNLFRYFRMPPWARATVCPSTEYTCPSFMQKVIGTTESCTVITTWALDRKRDLTGSAGQLLPGIIGRVEKPDGTLADFDEPGELVVKTQSLALGYANNEKAYVVTILLSANIFTVM